MISRQEVIDLGLSYLRQIGIDYLCKVCISNGGTCCIGCKHIEYGIGCQSRNTSCTAWLCGYLSLVFYGSNLLFDWSKFWSQVPGQGYRQDSTPSLINIENPLIMPPSYKRLLSLALAKDLEDVLRKKRDPTNFVLQLNESLNYYFEKEVFTDEEKRRRVERITKKFRRFKVVQSFLCVLENSKNEQHRSEEIDYSSILSKLEDEEKERFMGYIKDLGISEVLIEVLLEENLIR